MVVTGARKRQRFRESNSDVNDVSGELPEEPRRQGAPRRKVNRCIRVDKYFMSGQILLQIYLNMMNF